MRIVSKFKDYYDGLQRLGQNQELVYARFRKELPLAHWPFPQLHTGHTRCRINQIVVGFCGKVYPLIRVIGRDSNVEVDQYGNAKGKDFELCQTEEDVIAAEEKLRSPSSVHYNRKAWARAADERDKKNWRAEVTKLFLAYETQRDSFLQLFIDNHAPLFVARFKSVYSTTYCYYGTEPVITYNAQLAPYEFYRQFSPPQAFQEISMFVANLASPEKPIPSIDDKTMAEAKGFDKWSFRTPPRNK